MKMEHLGDDLYDYVTVRLDEEAYRLAEEHVTGCGQCRKDADDLRETIRLLDQFQPPPLSEEFKQRVKQRLRELPLPHRPLSYRIKEWFRIPYIKLPLEGLAVVALVLLTFTILHRGITPEVKTIPKELKITIEEVENPIVIKTTDVDNTLELLKGLIQRHNGKLLQTIHLDKGIKVTFSLNKEKEAFLFDDIRKLGEVRIEKEGYKDRQGNIVILLKKEEG